MRKYEIMIVVRPDVTDEEIEKLVGHMEGIVTGAGGKTEKIDKMGRRRLAYRVAHEREGYYILFVLEGDGDTVREFERRLKVTDSVIKYLTVRVDEEQKRVEKFKAMRAKQEARRPRSKPVAEPPAPAAAEPATG